MSKTCSRCPYFYNTPLRPPHIQHPLAPPSQNFGDLCALSTPSFTPPCVRDALFQELQQHRSRMASTSLCWLLLVAARFVPAPFHALGERFSKSEIITQTLRASLCRTCFCNNTQPYLTPNTANITSAPSCFFLKNLICTLRPVSRARVAPAACHPPPPTRAPPFFDDAFSSTPALPSG
jgi:hypothetical protein